jgi:ABC-2 type transport system ATP-binding protein
MALQVLGGAYRIHLEARGGDLAQGIEGIEGVVGLQEGPDGHYVVESRKDLRADVAEAVIQSGGRLLSMRLEQPGLDEVYSHYFREVGRDAA